YSEITKATRNNASFYIIDSIPTISIKASSSSSLSSLSNKTINNNIIKDLLSKTNIRKSSKKCSSSLDDNDKSTNAKFPSTTISTNNRK
ncbi:unnamed protein product, partial [Rotaria sordida]